MLAVVYVIGQLMAMTARQLVHAAFGFVLFWALWHAFMRHENQLHAGRVSRYTAAGMVVGHAPSKRQFCNEFPYAGHRCVPGVRAP